MHSHSERLKADKPFRNKAHFIKPFFSLRYNVIFNIISEEKNPKYSAGVSLLLHLDKDTCLKYHNEAENVANTHFTYQ